MHTPEIASFVNNIRETHMQFKISAADNDITLVSFGRHSTDPEYSYGPLSRNFALIHIVVSGCGYVVVDNIRYTIREKQCFVFFPGQIHFYESDTDNPWEYYYIGFCGSLMKSILMDAGFSINMIAKRINNLDAIIPLLRALCETARQPVQPLLQLGYLCQILHHLTMDAAEDRKKEVVERTPAAKKATVNIVHIASGIINHSYSEWITLDDLARNLNISAGYLNVCFRNEAGKSVYQFLLERRISVAKELLLLTDKPVKMIAKDVGYGDPLYFSKMFKKFTGCTPTEFREKGEDDK